MPKVNVKITVDMEITKEQQEQIDRIVSYAIRRTRYIVNDDQGTET